MNLEKKLRKLWQEGLGDILNLKSIDFQAFRLTHEEISGLISSNAILILSPGPSATIRLSNIKKGKLTLIHFERNILLKLHSDEIIAILLHEIWHALNPDRIGIEAEFDADNFAFQKGYGRWIIRGLQNGIRNKWLGFNPKECMLRIQKLQEMLGDDDEDDQEMENDISLDGLEKSDLDQEDSQWN